MHKRTVSFSIFQLAVNDAVASWFAQFDDWRKARTLAARRREEIVSELKPRILYDFGESDLRPLHSSVWDNNPYRLLIDGIMNRRSSEFDGARPGQHCLH